MTPSVPPSLAPDREAPDRTPVWDPRPEAPTDPGAPPAPPPESVYRSLLGDQSRVGLSKSLWLAVLLHLAVFGAAFAMPRLFPGTPRLRKPIVARLVALGKPRDQHLLPRKEEPAPTPLASKTAPPAPQVANAAPSAARPSSRPAKVARPATRAELMAQALAGVRGDPAPKARAPDPERAGAADGSPIGTAATAEAGERYFGEIHDVIQQNYVVPSVISERERLFLSATAVVWIARDGRILRHRLEKPSGNTFFDNALEAALARSKLPPPPPELARDLAASGVAINFKP